MIACTCLCVLAPAQAMADYAELIAELKEQYSARDAAVIGTCARASSVCVPGGPQVYVQECKSHCVNAHRMSNTVMQPVSVSSICIQYLYSYLYPVYVSVW